MAKSPEDILQRVFDEEAGALRFVGAGEEESVRHWKQVFLTPNMVMLDGAEIDIRWGVTVLRFDDTVREGVKTNLPVPDDMDLSVNPKVRVHMAPSQAQSSGTGFRVQVSAAYVADGESYDTDKTDYSNVEHPVSGTSGVRSESVHELDASQMERGDDILLTVRRDVEYEYNRNGDMVVPLIMFEYVVNRLGKPYEE